jgi:hypothetical protein
VVNGHRSAAQLSLGGGARTRIPAIPPPTLDEARARLADPAWRRFLPEFVALAILAVLFATVLAGMYGSLQPRSDVDTVAVVERILRAESNGNSKAKNSRSTATGSGQFLEQTWLEMVQKHRQDLATGRTRVDLLELRTDPVLTREIVTRMVEGNTRTLKKRGLPVTPGTLYLAHFAGSAGAVAVLTGADHLDAATLMAAADSTGKSSREQLVKANPFLASFTVGDMKSWADRKMRG